MSSQPPSDSIDPAALPPETPPGAPETPRAAGDAAVAADLAGAAQASAPSTAGDAAGPAPAAEGGDEFEAAMQAAMQEEAAAAAHPDAVATPDGMMGTALTQEELDAVLAASGIDLHLPDLNAPSAAAASGAAAHGGEQAFVPPSLDDQRAAAANDPDNESIAIIQDVTLDVSVELGRTTMLVEDVLRLGPGAVVELDKLAGDPVEIFVNERLVARGEVLVLNDDFCVRVSEIVTPVDEPAAEGQPA